MDRRKFLCRAFNYMESKFGDKITVADMVNVSIYSIPQFSRIFTEFSKITEINGKVLLVRHTYGETKDRILFPDFAKCYKLSRDCLSNFATTVI